VNRPLPELPGTEHRFVDVDDVRLHVAEAGSGEPLLMLHGWPQNWWQWRRLIPPLAERYRVICPDQRGFGWSEAPATGYEKEALAEEYERLLDALGHERVRLVGHDWGGYAGFLICLRHPERVERYLALNTGHPFVRADLRGLLQAWRFAYQWVLSTPGVSGLALRRLADSPDTVRRLSGVDASVWSDEDVEVFFGQFREPLRVRATNQLYRTFALAELPAAVRGRYRQERLETATLFLHGADDPVVRPNMLEGFERQAPGMRLEYVPGIGHFIAEEAAELVRDRALEFFSG
jgi:pimeloyl-ACP methyl ester carboxylesterase